MLDTYLGDLGGRARVRPRPSRDGGPEPRLAPLSLVGTA